MVVFRCYAWDEGSVNFTISDDRWFMLMLFVFTNSSTASVLPFAVHGCLTAYRRMSASIRLNCITKCLGMTEWRGEDKLYHVCNAGLKAIRISSVLCGVYVINPDKILRPIGAPYDLTWPDLFLSIDPTIDWWLIAILTLIHCSMKAAAYYTG